MTPKEKLNKIWAALKPEQKKKTIIAGIIMGILLFSLAFYHSTHSLSKTQAPAKTTNKRELGIDQSKVLEKSLYNESRQSMSDLKKQVDEMKKKLEEKEQDKKLPDSAEKDDKPDLSRQLVKKWQPEKDPRGQQKQETPRVSAPPIPSGSASLPPGVPPAPGAVAVQSKPEVYGAIEVVSQRNNNMEKNESKKKVGLKIYLPPSFMEATLLSGIYAPTSTGGAGSPLPVLIRIKNLAILPNRVKGDLKGCFLIGEAKGSLADERAHVRLNTLSCLTKGGQSVIDQKIKGYAVDSDGFVGLRGNVVSKMGGAVARSLLAGFIVGFGDAVSASSVTTTTSGLGTTQTLDTDNATKAGFGKGISQAAHDLQKFLLDLGKQAIPVIEVGAMRNITIVVSEGIELEVKERPGVCMGGGTKCIN